MFQLFMCLLWILLQFVVLFMYWDFTPQDDVRQSNGVVREEVEQEEEENEEGKPLVGPNELTGSYGTVTSVQSRASSVANGDVTHVSPPPSPPPEDVSSSPFKNFSGSRGDSKMTYSRSEIITLEQVDWSVLKG